MPSSLPDAARCAILCLPMPPSSRQDAQPSKSLVNIHAAGCRPVPHIPSTAPFVSVTLFQIIINVHVRQRRQTAPALHLHAEKRLDRVDSLALG